MTSPEGSIVSPGYPSSYGENAECIWRIEVSHGSRVLFAFVDLDMESQPSGCAFDYVEVKITVSVLRLIFSKPFIFLIARFVTAEIVGHR